MRRWLSEKHSSGGRLHFSGEGLTFVWRTLWLLVEAHSYGFCGVGNECKCAKYFGVSCAIFQVFSTTPIHDRQVTQNQILPSTIFLWFSSICRQTYHCMLQTPCVREAIQLWIKGCFLVCGDERTNCSLTVIVLAQIYKWMTSCSQLWWIWLPCFSSDAICPHLRILCGASCTRTLNILVSNNWLTPPQHSNTAVKGPWESFITMVFHLHMTFEHRNIAAVWRQNVVLWSLVSFHPDSSCVAYFVPFCSGSEKNDLLWMSDWDKLFSWQLASGFWKCQVCKRARVKIWTLSVASDQEKTAADMWLLLRQI